MKKFLFLFSAAAILTSCGQGESESAKDNDVLRFNPSTYSEQELQMTDGTVVKYRAYEKLYYVRNVEDSTYQYLNIYVPEDVTNSTQCPIFLRTYIGGYMSSQAKHPSATDATGRALQEGYVVCIPGARGWDSANDLDDGKTIYNGRCPAALCDLKAAVRYLRFNDDVMPGSAEKIVTDGTSAGGAMSALLGATGNSPSFASYLSDMGAADERDDVFAAVCYCPITDLQHADMAYEWTYGSACNDMRNLTEEHLEMSRTLSSQYDAYINTLGLTNPFDGTPLTSDNYVDYMKMWLIKSLQRAVNEGCELPVEIGVVFNELSSSFSPTGAGNAHGIHITLNVDKDSNKSAPRDPERRRPQHKQDGQTPKPRKNDPHAPTMLAELQLDSMNANKHALPSFRPTQNGEFVIDLDLAAYMHYVASSTNLKSVPSFDALGICGHDATPENKVFGDKDGNSSNFTDFAMSITDSKIDDSDAARIALYNPMVFIGNSNAKNAKYWYIRHGGKDRDTSFPIAINLATKLMNEGADVNFAIPYNRPHSGDYNLDDLFCWLRTIK